VVTTRWWQLCGGPDTFDFNYVTFTGSRQGVVVNLRPGTVTGQAIWNADRRVHHSEHHDRVLFRAVTDGGKRLSL
jgi:hypothetical protein